MAKRKGVYARDIDRLNFVFALIALGCLLSVVWMIWDDYAREWKQYQREFQVVEQEVVQAQLESERTSVDQAQLTQLQQRRDAAEQRLEAQRGDIEVTRHELEEVQVRLDLATQQFRFARSIYDARRWEYEEAAHQPDSDPSSEQERMLAAEARVAEAEAAVEQLEAEANRFQAEIATLEADVRDAESEIDDMTREIDRLQQRVDDLRFGLVYYLRNAPMLDAFNPSLTIRQAVISDIPIDLNFASAPRVDRCESCHLGARSDSYASYSQPFTSHPRLDLYVTDTSVHPADEFGCTSCHFGKGRATSFYSAVHTPSSEAERERWEEEHGWAEVELWEWPMRPSFETEAGCLKCHIGDTWLPDAPTLEYGLGLIENLGCYACHQLDRFDDHRTTGFSLEHVATKTTPEWAYAWIMDPKGFRPDTKMPKFFGLANTSDEYWQRRNVVEVDAIVTSLFDRSTDVELDAAPAGDAARGETLVNEVGCLGCHITDQPGSNGYPDDEPRFAGYRHQGPNLSGIGSKASADWVYTWIRDPEHVWADTRMPSLRLSSQEAADITAYLMTLRQPNWENRTTPSVDTELRDEVVLEYLRNQLTTADARARLNAMTVADKRLYLGEQLIGRYGCYGCHTIPGFEDRGRIGTSLSDWGSKPATRLDFGLLDLEHNRRAFIEQKLRSPRSYDDGKIKRPQELTRMPNFQLTEQEIDAVATAVLGYTDEEIPESKLPEATPRREAMEAGRRLVQEYSCRSCHIVEGRGGKIRDVIVDWRGGTYGENEAVAAAYAPPNLNTQGAKTQPDWLYRFLRDPSDTIRPWLGVRMPTFGFSDEELNTLTQYFSALDGAPYPFDERYTIEHTYPADLVRVGETLATGQLQCFRCHLRGEQTPNDDPTTWAPDMTKAPERLRFEWLQDWIADPQSIFPGTKMPQYWQSLEPGTSFLQQLDGDPRRQIEAIASYIMSLESQ